MDRIEPYLNGYKFAEAVANRNHTIFFANQTFKTAADLFEICLDALEPDLDNQLESARAKMHKSNGFPFIPEVTES